MHPPPHTHAHIKSMLFCDNNDKEKCCTFTAHASVGFSFATLGLSYVFSVFILLARRYSYFSCSKYRVHIKRNPGFVVCEQQLCRQACPSAYSVTLISMSLVVTAHWRV